MINVKDQLPTQSIYLGLYERMSCYGNHLRIYFPVLRDIQEKDSFECLVPSNFLKQVAKI